MATAQHVLLILGGVSAQHFKQLFFYLYVPDLCISRDIFSDHVIDRYLNGNNDGSVKPMLPLQGTSTVYITCRYISNITLTMVKVLRLWIYRIWSLNRRRPFIKVLDLPLVPLVSVAMLHSQLQGRCLERAP